MVPTLSAITLLLPTAVPSTAMQDDLANLFPPDSGCLPSADRLVIRQP